jgi:phytoene/squalene synthetase
MAGAASTAAAISAADRNFSLAIQLLHLMRNANSVWLLYGNGEVIGPIKGTHYHVPSTPREVGVP